MLIDNHESIFSTFLLCINVTITGGLEIESKFIAITFINYKAWYKFGFNRICSPSFAGTAPVMPSLKG